MKYAFLIAAPASGSGKTTIARGLMALFTQQGLRVQPFKCGPDYIDTKFHEAVCHRPSINLDTFMATDEHVRDLFGRYTSGGDDKPAWAREPADIAIVEGMMGLFDGYDRDRGSCADVARVLSLPVVLVVDARSASYSLTAVLQGITHFRPGLRFAGVIFNKVGSPRHAAMLREVAEEAGITCLGCIPKQTALEQGSRYLGLDFSEQADQATLVATMDEHVDWHKLLSLHAHTDCGHEAGMNADTPMCAGRHTYVCEPTHLSDIGGSPGWDTQVSQLTQPSQPAEIDKSHRCVSQVGQVTSTSRPADIDESPRRIFVARNAESFSFVYQETLDLLSELGEVQFFDPETDPSPALSVREEAECNRLDEGLQPTRVTTPALTGMAGAGSAGALLYLPGGYPEKHLDALVKAERMRRLIHDFAEAGGRIIAECGGMMYLCREIITDDGASPMCDVLPYSITARHADRRLSLGYRRFVVDGHELCGHELRGHEFHYTRFADPAPTSAVDVFDAKGRAVPTAVLHAGNVMASYTHLSPTSLMWAVRQLWRGEQP